MDALVAECMAKASAAVPELTGGDTVRISGGISNHLFKVSKAGSKSVLVRFYGAGLPGCDRDSEEKLVCILSDRCFGPKVLLTFPGGRVEEFWETRRSVLPAEAMQSKPVDMLSMTAERISELHEMRLVIPGRESYCLQVQQWVDMCTENGPVDLILLRTELQSLESLRPKAQSDAEASIEKLLLEPLLCHMDLFASNLMFDEAQGDVRFIDYEYAMTAPAGLDIANHFSGCTELIEGEGVTFDVSLYPSKAQRLAFLHIYVASRKLPRLSEVGAEFALKLLLALTAEAELRWVVWGLLQRQLSELSFDYGDYAKQRWAAFQVYKEWAHNGATPAE